METLSSQMPVFVRSINQNLYSPAQAVLALGYSRPTWQVGAELGWVGWSRFPTPTAEIELDLALQPLEVDLPIPAAPVPPSFSGYLGPAHRRRGFGLEHRCLRRLGAGRILLRALTRAQPTRRYKLHR